MIRLSDLAPLAQLDRASVYGTEGYRFESCGVYLSCFAVVAGASRCRLVAIGAECLSFLGIYGDLWIAVPFMVIWLLRATWCNP